MRFSFLVGSILAYLFAQVQSQSAYERWERSDALAAPNCTSTCLATYVPMYCGNSTTTNATCLCTDTSLAIAITPCISEACNIPDNLEFHHYQAVTCGFPNDKTLYNDQFYAYYALSAIVLVFVVVRICTRHFLDIGLGNDDYMMIAATIMYYVTIGSGISIARQGFGLHTYWLSTAQITRAYYWIYLSDLLYLVSITFTKLSLLLFFHRIFPSHRFRFWSITIALFVIISNFALLIALILQCVPLNGAWLAWQYKVRPAEMKCVKVFSVVFVAAFLSILHNLMILCMPIPTLWRLNLPWRKKLNVLIMFWVGGFVVVCSCARIPSLSKLKGSSDPSYDQAPIIIQTNLEIAVGIICACLPACRALIGHVFPALKMSLATQSQAAGTYAERGVTSAGNRKIREGGGGGGEGSMRSLVEITDVEMGALPGQDSLGRAMGSVGSMSMTGSGSASLDGRMSNMTGEGWKEPKWNFEASVDKGDERGLGRSKQGIVMTRTVELTETRVD